MTTGAFTFDNNLPVVRKRILQQGSGIGGAVPTGGLEEKGMIVGCKQALLTAALVIRVAVSAAGSADSLPSAHADSPDC